MPDELPHRGRRRRRPALRRARRSSCCAARERPVCLVGSQLFWSRRRDAYPEFVEHVRHAGLRERPGARQPRSRTIRTGSSRRARTRSSKADVVLIFGTPLDFRIGYGRELAHQPEREAHPGRPRRRASSAATARCDVGIIGDTGLVMEALTALREGRDASSRELSKPLARRAARGSRSEKWERLRAAARVRRGADQSAPRLRRDRQLRRRRTRSSSATAATSSAPRPTCSASARLRPLARRGPARHARRRARATPWRPSSPRPKSDVIIMYGDGAFGLNMMEFEACIRQKINVVGVIGNDAAWTQIRRGQVQIYGPDRTPACKLALHALRPDGRGARRPRRVGRDARASIRPALERALGCGKPAVVNVKIGAQRLPQGRHLGLERCRDARPHRGHHRHRQRDPLGEGHRHQLAVPRARAARARRDAAAHLDDPRRARRHRRRRSREFAAALRRRLHLGRRRADARRRHDRGRRARPRPQGDPPSRDREPPARVLRGRTSTRRASRWPRCPTAPS